MLLFVLLLPATGQQIRLAGGFILCNRSTCKGTSPDRELWVDATTGNIHIGFAVFEK